MWDAYRSWRAKIRVNCWEYCAASMSFVPMRLPSHAGSPNEIRNRLCDWMRLLPRASMSQMWLWNLVHRWRENTSVKFRCRVNVFSPVCDVEDRYLFLMEIL